MRLVEFKIISVFSKQTTVIFTLSHQTLGLVTSKTLKKSLKVSRCPGNLDASCRSCGSCRKCTVCGGPVWQGDEQLLQQAAHSTHHLRHHPHSLHGHRLLGVQRSFVNQIDIKYPACPCLLSFQHFSTLIHYLSSHKF